MGFMDKMTDGVASALSGRKVETIIVSFDQILKCVEMVINEAVSEEELNEIAKVLKGSFLTSLKSYDTKNEKYRLTTVYAGTIGSNRLKSEISVMELESGKIYTYKVLFRAKKFKKAAKQLVNARRF